MNAKTKKTVAVIKFKRKAGCVAGRVKTLKFGSVTVEVPPRKAAEVKRNIKEGQLALARAIKSIFTPGVKIEAAKGVPLFYADPKCPGKIVRELDGRRESGDFVNGKFKTCR